MLFTFDLYGSIGIFLPHIQIVEITYLILRERTLFIYDKIIEFLLWCITPFLWIYQIFKKITNFFQTKQQEKADKKAYEEYNKNEFKQKQEEKYKKEQVSSIYQIFKKITNFFQTKQ